MTSINFDKYIAKYTANSWKLVSDNWLLEMENGQKYSKAWNQPTRKACTPQTY